MDLSLYTTFKGGKMKIKFLIATTLVAVGSLFVTIATASPAMAFSASDCKKGTMYYDYNYTTDKDGNIINTTDDQKKKLTKPKDAADIKTIADCNLAATEYDLMDRATTIINVIVGVVGVIAVAVIVIGGIFYTTSAGDAAKAKKGQNAILYGIVGLIIAILAYAIVNFVLKNVF